MSWLMRSPLVNTHDQINQHPETNSWDREWIQEVSEKIDAVWSGFYEHAAEKSRWGLESPGVWTPCGQDYWASPQTWAPDSSLTQETPLQKCLGALITPLFGLPRAGRIAQALLNYLKEAAKGQVLKN